MIMRNLIPVTDSDGGLQCAHCGGDYLHHYEVTVFERDEDAEEGLQVAILDGQVTISKDMTGNPSLRRHGISILLWCEDCGKNTGLEIAQHKGQTFINCSPSIHKTAPEWVNESRRTDQ